MSSTTLFGVLATFGENQYKRPNTADVQHIKVDNVDRARSRDDATPQPKLIPWT